MHRQNPDKKILVATSMNLTADLVAEALYKIEEMKNKICRIYSVQREDLFNQIFEQLPEWSIMYKMLFEDQRKASSHRESLQALRARHQVESYFKQTNFWHDDYLRREKDDDGWINLQKIYDFRKMKVFH